MPRLAPKVFIRLALATRRVRLWSLAAWVALSAVWVGSHGAAVALAAPAGATQAAAKPNILVIVADDLGYADVGVQGGAEVPTPHLDRLAQSGLRCTQGYVASPYCSPSRAGYLTGRYPSRFGHEFNPHVGEETLLGLPLDQTTIADALRQAGYATALFGKWHQGFSPKHHPQSRGFDEFFGFLVGGHNFLLQRDAEPMFRSGMSLNLIYRGRQRQALDGYTTDLFTDEAIAFIKQNHQRPWFITLTHHAVHTPLESLEQHQSRIPAEVTDPARRGYLSLLLGLDDNLGRLARHLAESGAERNTLVVFFSDNGGSGRKPFFAYNTGRNAPLKGDKGQTLEGGIRVPFFVSWPGRLAAQKTFDQPVIALDVLPTALAAAGAAVPAGLDGVNLLPHLLGENQQPPHEALYWRFGPQRAIRQGPWKLVEWRDFDNRQNSGWQLYDLSRDPGEQQNLAPAEPQRVAALAAAWELWNRRNVAPLWHGGPTEDPTAPAPK